MTRILLANDQQVVRQALRCLLEREPDLQVVGEVSDGLEVVPLVAQLKPDVLVTDVALPGLYGLEVTRRVRESAPGTGVVILSRYPASGTSPRRCAAGRSATWAGTRTPPSCCAPCARSPGGGLTSARRFPTTRSRCG